jgi:hypothetical protein
MSEAKVIDLAAEREARMPHCQGEARCLACGHTWRAVAPTGVNEMECPECALLRGVWVHPLSLEDGAVIWRCNCGGELFFLGEDAPTCATCGAVQNWEPLASGR